ncbi:MAG: spore cortex biosynthesis protein YabQ [Oscillospiraceae bacterium]
MLTQEFWMFLASIFIGAVIGVLYDVFKVSRIIIKTNNIVTFIEDVAFCLASIILTFIFISEKNDGILRMFLLFGNLMGATIYFCTISVVITKIIKFIVKFVKNIYNKIKIKLVNKNNKVNIQNIN